MSFKLACQDYTDLLIHIKCKSKQIIPMDKVKLLISYIRSEKSVLEMFFNRYIKKITIFAENMF